MNNISLTQVLLSKIKFNKMPDIKEQIVSKRNVIITCGLKCHRLKKARVLLGKMNAQVMQNIKS